MKFTKQDLLTLLIGLFLFASCKNPDGVGLDVDPGTAITGTLVTSEVRSETIAEPAANTQSLTRYPLGYMVDPVFGTTKSSVAMTVTPSTLSYDFGTSPVLDSAVLVLRIDTTANKFYGDTISSQYSVDVYQLTNKVTTFKSSDVQAHNAQLLGNVKKKLYPNTPIKVTNVVVGKADTLQTVKAQIRIPLDKAFIQSQILSLPTTGTSTNAKFIDYFKGLYAEVNKNTSTGTGGVAFINLSNSYLQLVYKKTSSTSGVDTVSVNFPVSTTSAAAATIVHDYTGTAVDTQLKNPPTSSPSPYTVTYTQGLAGVKTKISFPALSTFTGTYGKVVVNKAELVVDLSAGTYTYPFTPIQRLSLYRWDIANQPTTTPDYSSTSPGIIGGYYDSLKNRYIFIVTNYVQGLIDKTIPEDYGTFIAPTGLEAFQVIPSAITAERSVLGASTNTTNKVKLNIYYTKIN